MDILLLALVFPIAIILLAIVLQKVLGNPLLVAATFFAILLILTYTAFDSSFLIYAILYTILAYVTAILTRLICNIIQRFCINNNQNCACCTCRNTNNSNSNNSDTNNEILSTSGNVNVSNEGNSPIVILPDSNQLLNNRRNRVNRCCLNRR